MNVNPHAYHHYTTIPQHVQEKKTSIAQSPVGPYLVTHVLYRETLLHTSPVRPSQTYEAVKCLRVFIAF